MFVLKPPDPNNPGMQQRVHEKIPFKTLKEVKQACTMYGSTAPFTLGLLQSVVGNTAMPPNNWTGLAVESRFCRVMSGAGKP
jgi:hypothetical protein